MTGKSQGEPGGIITAGLPSLKTEKCYSVVLKKCVGIRYAAHCANFQFLRQARTNIRVTLRILKINLDFHIDYNLAKNRPKSSGTLHNLRCCF